MTIILDGTNGITQEGKFNSNATFGFRNRIFNGDMRIDQRNAGAAVTASGSFPVDRFGVTHTTDGAFSAQQDSSAPAGFVNSVKITTTTADGTLAATQTLNYRQAIEGTNVSDLAWGTANAKTVTLSFWVRSSLTGTFGGSLRNSAVDRSYPFSYSISVADTWEYKSVTIAGDISGTWLTTNGVGVYITFGLGSGSDRSGTAGAWASGNSVQSTGSVSVIGTLNATWYITGVQLEVGSVATPFERRPYGTELALCQRYYWRVTREAGQNTRFAIGVAVTTTQGDYVIKNPVTMRIAASSLDQTGTAANYGITVPTCSSVPIILAVGTPDSSSYRFTVASGLTVGNAVTSYGAVDGAYLGFSAEL
jgi:hypothetical protein